jgi:hypothetical protein
MAELGGKPMPFGITMQERGVRWLRLGITMGGLGDEFTAENYADRLQEPTQAVGQELNLKPTRPMLMTQTTQRTD